MAYDFIPTSTKDIENARVFKSNEYSMLLEYLLKKYKNVKDPIALSKKSGEIKNVKITRKLQLLCDLKKTKKELNLKEIKIGFGEGSRGGRGVKNKGGAFEDQFERDLKVWWSDSDDYNNRNLKKIIEEIANHYNWSNIKTFEAQGEGSLNQRRPLVFVGKNAYIGTSSDPNIGKTVTDVTVNTDKGKVFFSLKATGTVTFFNAGVSTILSKSDMQKNYDVTNKNGLALLNILGIDSKKFASVFNSYDKGDKVKSYSEDVTNKIDKPAMIKLLQSGIGYGFHYVHAKRPTEIHHFEMTKKKMEQLANPTKCVAYYGGLTGGGKRIDVVVDTPMITLKFNLRNKQGGVYPSHIMCDYTFKKY